MGFILAVIIAFALSILFGFFSDEYSVKKGWSFVSFIGFLLLSLIFSNSFLSSIIGINPMWFRIRWLSFILFGAVYAVLMLLLWKPLQKKTNRITVISITLTVVLMFGIAVGTQLYKNSLPRSKEEIDLSIYTPFGYYQYRDGGRVFEDSLVAKLETDASVERITTDIPRLDGATALYPLYASFVRAAYPLPAKNDALSEYDPYGSLRNEVEEQRPYVTCSRTSYAFENLVDGYADIVFLAGISDEQQLMAEERGLELGLTPIGYEAFVFFVNSKNAITDLSSDDIRRIYSGEITNWSEVGGKNNEIRAYQRPNNSGSQTILQQIMGTVPIVSAPLEEIQDTMAGMHDKVADYRNFKNALGYSFLYYMRDMIGENDVKLLSIDNIAPTKENIVDGSYPFAGYFYAITVKKNGEYLNEERTENIDKLLEWILSPQGQYLVEETGYIPVN